MSERPDSFQVCDVCGRTLLKGERVFEYVDREGEELRACVLCRSRAESSGWTPAALAHTLAQSPPARARRGQALRRRLGRAAARARPAGRAVAAGAEQPEAGAPAPERAATVDGEPGERAEGPRPTRPQRRAATPRPKPSITREEAQLAVPRVRRRKGPEAIMRGAVERFNSSEERRKVAGLIRSLGAPNAAIRPDPERQMATVTVAWELSWYQWEVNGEAEADAVYEIAKGSEVSELADEVPAWNATVGEDGSLRLRSTSSRRGEPAQD